jgi:2,3-bisphosphoglycerate-independent phosphoglycerate mutase
MKYIILVPDGVADEPIASLGGKTPLEAARTPNMDWLAQNGLLGLVKIIPDGMPPGSDVGNMSVLGYDPSKGFTGRAPLEAASLGIDLADDELAFRCNLVTVRDGVMIDYSAGHITIDDAAQVMKDLIQALSQEPVRFYTGKSYRHIMLLKTEDKAKFMKIACTPPHDIMGQKVEGYLPKGSGSELLLGLMERSRPLLAGHPVNKAKASRGEDIATQIWLWGQGPRPNLETYQKRFGLKGSIISAVDLVNGIGRLVGFKVISVPGATGYYDTNYKGKAEFALNSLKDNDFVYVHVESTDEAGHNGDAQAKTRCVEDFDRLVVGTVLDAMKGRDDVRILVTPDHPTPVAKRTHTRTPVPFVMYGKNVEANHLSRYNEALASTAGVRFSSGEEMIKYFMK